jgi:exosortase
VAANVAYSNDFRGPGSAVDWSVDCYGARVPLTRSRYLWLAVSAAAVASFGLLFGPVLIRLARDWSTDDNYSHGYLIIPLAAYFVHERWPALRQIQARPQTVVGLLVVAVGLLLLAVGTLASEFFVTRVSLLVVVSGAILFLLGGRHLRALAFPVGFLLLMIPLPAIFFNQIGLPLQLIASRFGESIVSLAGIPVLRDGNVIVLASTTLEVAEACSGIRSLVTLLTLGIVLGHFTDPRPGVRVLIATASVPLAIVTNGLRVAGTGIAAHVYGPAAAEGFFHTFSGWLVFLAAMLMLMAASTAIKTMFPRPSPQPAALFS